MAKPKCGAVISAGDKKTIRLTKQHCFQSAARWPVGDSPWTTNSCDPISPKPGIWSSIRLALQPNRRATTVSGVHFYYITLWVIALANTVVTMSRGRQVIDGIAINVFPLKPSTRLYGKGRDNSMSRVTRWWWGRSSKTTAVRLQ